MRKYFPAPIRAQKDQMQITPEWLESISDEQGLTRGQRQVLDIWARRNPAWGYLPDQVARFIEGCKGYREIPQHVREWLYAKA